MSKRSQNRHSREGGNPLLLLRDLLDSSFRWNDEKLQIFYHFQTVCKGFRLWALGFGLCRLSENV